VNYSVFACVCHIIIDSFAKTANKKIKLLLCCGTTDGFHATIYRVGQKK